MIRRAVEFNVAASQDTERRALTRQSTTRRVTDASGLLAAVDDTSVETILVAAGTYELTNSTPGLCACEPPFEHSSERLNRLFGYAALCIIGRQLSIRAETNGTVVLNATKQTWRVIYVGGGGRAELVGLTITGGFAERGGGLLIAGGGRATLTSCAITGNKAAHGGGLAIWEGSSQATLTSCTISENKASLYGGGLAISAISGQITMTGCVISGNTVRDGRAAGLAAYGKRSQVTMTECVISGNFGGDGGGGGLEIYGQANLTSCTISGNKVAQGGGLSIHGTANLTSCTISGNVADPNFVTGGDPRYGGAGGLNIEDGGKATLTSCTISGNSAAGAGGGLAVHGHATLISCVISGNEASYGGGLYLVGKAALSDVMITGNHAIEGGGLFMECRPADFEVVEPGDFTSHCSMNLLSSTVTHNDADWSGGGLHLGASHAGPQGVALIIGDSVFVSNRAPAGSSVANQGNATVYLLPTPPGTYLPHEYTCDSSCVGFPRVEQRATLSLIEDVDLPHICPRGYWCDGVERHPCPPGKRGDGTGFSNSQCGVRGMVEPSGQ